jgi:hypothetical protein
VEKGRRVSQNSLVVMTRPCATSSWHFTYPFDFDNPIDLNRYSYTANNPVNGSDPMGLSILAQKALVEEKDVEITVGASSEIVYYPIGHVSMSVLPTAGAGLFLFGALPAAVRVVLATLLLVSIAGPAIAPQVYASPQPQPQLEPARPSSEPSTEPAETDRSRAVYQFNEVGGGFKNGPSDLDFDGVSVALADICGNPANCLQHRNIDQWVTWETLDSNMEIEIRMHEGLVQYNEFGWLGR